MHRYFAGLLLVAACGVTVTHEHEVAAPQHYRPADAKEEWLIEGSIDTEVETEKGTGHETFTQRILRVLINKTTAIEGKLPLDANGGSTGTLDGSYQGARIHVDCSSQRKTSDWFELRCRVFVNDKLGVTLVM